MTKKIYTIFLLFTFITVASLAQNTVNDSAALLKEVVVGYQAKKFTPVTFQNLFTKDFKTKLTGQEPSFLIGETPSVTVYSDAGNTQGYSYYRLRGIDQTRINTTLDGMPLNEPEDQGAYFSNYPDILNSVSKIQIQRGSGTTKNGVACFGGSVELFSPDLTDSASGSTGVNYGSFNSLRLFGAYNSGVKNHHALYARASHVSSNGYKYHSGNNSQSVFISTGLFYTKTSWKLNVLAGHQKNKLAWLGVDEAAIAKDRKTNANSPAEKDAFTQALLQLQNNWKPAANTTIQSSVYYTHLNGNYHFDLNNFLSLPSTTELYNYAFKSHLIGFFSTYNFVKNNFNLTAGVHGNRYNRQHKGSEKSSGTLYTNTGYKKEASVFAKAGYTKGKTSLFTEVQYRSSSFNYKGSVSLQKFDWQFINPKAGVSIQASPVAVVYYSIGRTGREPTRNDMFGGNDDLLTDSTGRTLISIADAEYVVNHELGLRHQTNKLNVSFNFYYMNFKNEIVLNGKFGPNGLALTNNVEKSYRTGIETSITHRLHKYFSLVNNSSFNYSRIKLQSQKFSPVLTPPVIINQEIIYKKDNFSAALQGRYQQHSFIDFANSNIVGSYALLNVRAEYLYKKIKAALFLNNITNTKYYNHGYVDFNGSGRYFVQAPVNYSVALHYSF